MYKVVIRRDDKLFSATEHDAQVEYKLGEENFPSPLLPKSKLFVFEELSFARRFLRVESVHSKNKYEIWEVTVTNPEMGYRIADIFTDIKFAKSLWNKDNDAKSYGAPTGTFYCDSLQLIQQVV